MQSNGVSDCRTSAGKRFSPCQGAADAPETTGFGEARVLVKLYRGIGPIIRKAVELFMLRLIFFGTDY